MRKNKTNNNNKNTIYRIQKHITVMRDEATKYHLQVCKCLIGFHHNHVRKVRHEALCIYININIVFPKYLKYNNC